MDELLPTVLIKEHIQEAVVSASLCWENLCSNLIFDSHKARSVGLKLYDFIIQEMEEAYLKGYGDAVRELTEVIEKNESGMPQDYKFEIETCPDCGQPVAANWIVRHRKANCEVG